MGMFDNLKCSYPLPINGLENEVFQTKDTPAQMLDLYEIRADGTLWHENYDTEDKSDPNAEGIKRLLGCCTKVNKRWEFEDTFTGEIKFYTFLDDNERLWFEFSSYFINGKLQCLVQIPKR